jgi:hypothetical protein
LHRLWRDFRETSSSTRWYVIPISARKVRTIGR